MSNDKLSVFSTLVESKNVENKSEGEGKGVRVWVRVIRTFKNYLFRHFTFRRFRNKS